MARHDRMAALVERMLELHKRLGVGTPQAKTPRDQTLLEHQIEATDRQNDVASGNAGAWCTSCMG